MPSRPRRLAGNRTGEEKRNKKTRRRETKSRGVGCDAILGFSVVQTDLELETGLDPFVDVSWLDNEARIKIKPVDVNTPDTRARSEGSRLILGRVLS